MGVIRDTLGKALIRRLVGHFKWEKFRDKEEEILPGERAPRINEKKNYQESQTKMGSRDFSFLAF